MMGRTGNGMGATAGRGVSFRYILYTNIPIHWDLGSTPYPTPYPTLYKCIYMYMSISLSLIICIHMYIYVYIHICIHMYIYVYIHICIHMYVFRDLVSTPYPTSYRAGASDSPTPYTPYNTPGPYSTPNGGGGSMNEGEEYVLFVWLFSLLMPYWLVNVLHAENRFFNTFRL
jgi:hypothetical protein